MGSDKMWFYCLFVFVAGMTYAVGKKTQYCKYFSGELCCVCQLVPRQCSKGFTFKPLATGI